MNHPESAGVGPLPMNNPDGIRMSTALTYCRLHGLGGLRLADASVMPDVIRANTSATTIMIAERVAGWI